MAMEFDLGDADLDDEDVSDFDLGDDLDVALGDDDDASQEDAVELELPDDDEEFSAKTEVISTDFDEVTNLLEDEEEQTGEDQGIDLGMDDTGIMDVSDISLETGELQIAADAAEAEEDEDISVLDFGAEDFEEPTALVDTDDLDDSLAMDVDMDDEEARTGTFAPGDFDEPTAATASLDDLDDLMLPDDVDEVSTKLDLARAFIDMGDTEGARGSLEEVLAEGNEAQKEEAQQLLNQI
jgi:pilus assembly protein FimV